MKSAPESSGIFFKSSAELYRTARGGEI